MKVRIDNKIIEVSGMIYGNENEITKLLRSLKLYNMKAYKQFIFAKVHELKDVGNGDYSINLFTDEKFKLIYGPVRIIVKLIDNVLVIKRIEPYELLHKGYHVLLNTYKGVPIMSNKEIFKIKLFEKTGKFRKD